MLSMNHLLVRLAFELFVLLNLLFLFVAFVLFIQVQNVTLDTLMLALLKLIKLAAIIAPAIVLLAMLGVFISVILFKTLKIMWWWIIFILCPISFPIAWLAMSCSRFFSIDSNDSPPKRGNRAVLCILALGLGVSVSLLVMGPIAVWSQRPRRITVAYERLHYFPPNDNS